MASLSLLAQRPSDSSGASSLFLLLYKGPPRFGISTWSSLLLLKPLATCSLIHLYMKVIILVAITFACRISELVAIMADPPFTVFHKDKVSLRLHPKFLPKVASSFHLNQSIHLSVFYPKPHDSHMEHAFPSLHANHCLLLFHVWNPPRDQPTGWIPNTCWGLGFSPAPTETLSPGRRLPWG